MAAEKTQAEVQALLRFLTQDAKIPLSTALPKYNLLKKQGLTTPDAIAKADANDLNSIFVDDKIAKQIHDAARRLSNPKKRAASTFSPASNKLIKTAEDKEADLAFPETSASLEQIRAVTIETNRAPLFLAFAVTVAKYTLPDQPLSSRLSVAQAVTSAGAQSKAKYIGLTNTTAEDEGWAQGQPKVKLMGREIAVMRRHVAVGADHDENLNNAELIPSATHEAFWGIDLEALKKSNGPLVAGKMTGSVGPPIHKPEAARGYLLRSVILVEQNAKSELPSRQGAGIKIEETKSPVKGKRATAAEKAAAREGAVAMLLKAIDYVCVSWSSTLSSEELDRRASSWYARVRPEVEGGQAGWGQRGKVPLSAILDLAKEH